MKKLFLVALLASILMVGTALAATTVKVSLPSGSEYVIPSSSDVYDKVTLTSFYDGTTLTKTTWSYCVDKPHQIYIGQDYDYTLQDVADYSSPKGYYAAWLIYSAYTDFSTGTSIGTDAQSILQNQIWDVLDGTDTTNYSNSEGYDTTILSNMFDILLPVSLSNSKLEVQDMIIYNPVPVPAAVWLLGSGLVGLVGFRRKKK